MRCNLPVAAVAWQNNMLCFDDGDVIRCLNYKLHKWRYSQIHKPMEGTPKAVTISEEPLLVLAGGAFTGSNFDNCRSSAEFDYLN